MKYLIPIFLIFAFAIPSIAHAQLGCHQPNCAPLEDYAILQNICDLFAIIVWIFCIVGYGLIIISLIISGIMYLTSAGNPEKVAKAKKAFLYGVIGGAIILSVSLIINFLLDVIAVVD